MTFSNCFRNLTNTFQKLSVLCQLRYQSYIFIPSPIHSSAYPPALPTMDGSNQSYILYMFYFLLCY